MAALAGGVVALVLGIIGIIVWWWQFIDLLMGGVPVIFILGGALAAYLGFEEIKDRRTAETFEDTSHDLKDEVQTLKDEIKELKAQKTEQGEEKENDSGK